MLCIVPAIARAIHSPLPLPESDALAHSDELAAALRAEILANGGAMPFSRFMELSLYAPGWGYYSAGASKFGAAGDFTTSPEIGALFAATLANAIAPVMQQLGPVSWKSAAAAVPSPKCCSSACLNWTRCPSVTRSWSPARTCVSASASVWKRR